MLGEMPERKVKPKGQVRSLSRNALKSIIRHQAPYIFLRFPNLVALAQTAQVVVGDRSSVKIKVVDQNRLLYIAFR